MARILKTPCEKMVVESPYNSELVKKVMKGELAAKSGKKGQTIDIDSLWK